MEPAVWQDPCWIESPPPDLPVPESHLGATQWRTIPITLTDNNNGESHEFPILRGTIGPGAADISSLYKETGSSPTTPGSWPPRAATAPSPTSTARRACCSTVATRSSSSRPRQLSGGRLSAGLRRAAERQQLSEFEAIITTTRCSTRTSRTSSTASITTPTPWPSCAASSGRCPASTTTPWT